LTQIPSQTGPRARPSPFRDREAAFGASFGEEAGWSVPISFTDSPEGRVAARESAAILDLSTIGRIKVTGKNRVDLLQRISTNDMLPLSPGHFAPTLFVTPKGRIVGRALVLDRGESLLLLIPGVGHEQLRAWIQRYVLADDFKMTDLSTESAAFALVGPRAPEVVKDLVGVGVGSLERDRFVNLEAAGVETLIAPYDALPSAWLFLAEMPGIVAIWDRACALGISKGLRPIGTADAEVLRVEAGIPGPGHELTEDWNPWEAALQGSFSLTKGCYTGQEVIARLNTYDKIQRRLVGVSMGAADPLDVPQGLFASQPGAGSDSAPQQREIGTLTSTVRSDRLGEAIGLAFVRGAFVEPGTELLVGQGRIRGTVRALPF
jgi:folate-binding protein YgfZ